MKFQRTSEHPKTSPYIHMLPLLVSSPQHDSALHSHRAAPSAASTAQSVSVSAHCPILPCIEKTFSIPHAKSHLKGGGGQARRLLKVHGFLPRIFERIFTWVSLRHGVFPRDTRIPKSDSFGFWGPNDTGFTPGPSGSPGDNF